MPRWLKNKETGRDTTAVNLHLELTRLDYAVLKNYMRDCGQEWTLHQAALNALKIGLEELAETYDPRVRK